MPANSMIETCCSSAISTNNSGIARQVRLPPTTFMRAFDVVRYCANTFSFQVVLVSLQERKILTDLQDFAHLIRAKFRRAFTLGTGDPVRERTLKCRRHHLINTVVTNFTLTMTAFIGISINKCPNGLWSGTNNTFAKLLEIGTEIETRKCSSEQVFLSDSATVP